MTSGLSLGKVRYQVQFILKYDSNSALIAGLNVMKSDQFHRDFLIKCTMELLFKRSARSAGFILNDGQSYSE